MKENDVNIRIKQPQSRQQKVDAMAEEIFIRLASSSLSAQYGPDAFRNQARAFAEAFYPEEVVPAPSVQMTKAV